MDRLILESPHCHWIDLDFTCGGANLVKTTPEWDFLSRVSVSMWNYLSCSAIMSFFFTLLPKKKTPAAAFVIPVSALYLVESNGDDEPSVGLNKDKDRAFLYNPSHPSPLAPLLKSPLHKTSRVLLRSGCCMRAQPDQQKTDMMPSEKLVPTLENTLVAPIS